MSFLEEEKNTALKKKPDERPLSSPVPGSADRPAAPAPAPHAGTDMQSDAQQHAALEAYGYGFVGDHLSEACVEDPTYDRGRCGFAGSDQYSCRPMNGCGSPLSVASATTVKRFCGPSKFSAAPSLT